MSKRIFDVFFAVTGLLLTAWLLLLLFILLSLTFRANGFFCQSRIGRYGRPFTIFKLRTIDPVTGKIPGFAAFLRKRKIDEFPQLLNVFLGDMSVVGPRPDVAGYYDRLEGEQRKLLELRPGLTSAASLKYYNEEHLLAQNKDLLQYNDTVIFPDKVKMNLEYYYRRSFLTDLEIIWKTFFYYL